MTLPSAGVQLRALVQSEVRQELRAGDVLLTTLPFAVAALVIVALSVGADVPLLRRIGPGLYWATVVVFGALIVLRRTHHDVPAHRDVLLLLGVDPIVSYLARAIVTGLYLMLFQGVLAPVAVVLFDPSLDAPLAAVGMAVLTAAGLAALGTLAGDLAAGGDQSRGRVALVPLLVVPLLVPLVLAAVQSQQAGLYQTTPWPWFLLAGAVVIVSLLGGVLAARTLSEGHT